MKRNLMIIGLIAVMLTACSGSASESAGGSSKEASVAEKVQEESSAEEETSASGRKETTALTDAERKALLTAYLEEVLYEENDVVTDRTFFYPFETMNGMIYTGEYQGETGILTGRLADLDGDSQAELIVFSLEYDEEMTEADIDKKPYRIVFEVFQPDGDEVVSKGGGILDEASVYAATIYSEIFLKEDEQGVLIGASYEDGYEGFAQAGLRFYRFRDGKVRELVNESVGGQDGAVMKTKLAESLEQGDFSETLISRWENALTDDTMERIVVPENEPGVEIVMLMTSEIDIPGNSSVAWNPFAAYISDPDAAYEDYEMQFAEMGWTQADIQDFVRRFHNGEYGVRGKYNITDKTDGTLQEDDGWKEAYREVLSDWTFIAPEQDYLIMYFGEDAYDYDEYFICDLDDDGIPELFLYSNEMRLTSVFTWRDRVYYLTHEAIEGLNLSTREVIVHGHWHGAGGSGSDEYAAYKISDDLSGMEETMYIDMMNEEYTIHNLETDSYDRYADSALYDQLYETHVAGQTLFETFPRYPLTDLGGLR